MATVKFKTHAEFQKYNFFRSPEWRWERVLALVDRPGQEPGRCTAKDDDYVRRARKFLLGWKQGYPETRERLKYEEPGLYYAYDFHQRLVDDPDAAMYIQARLLARQTPEQIGPIMGVLPDAVHWYSCLYFDVLDRLDQRDWITKQILVPAMMRAPVKIDEQTGVPGYRDSSVAKPHLDGSLKLFAYFGGPYLVDILLGGMQPGKPLQSPEDLAAWCDGTIANTVRRRTMQAIHTVDINKYNVMELVTAYTRLVELARSEDAENVGSSTQEKHIKAMIDELPWALGSDGNAVYEGTIIGRMDDMPSELRDDELLMLASGRPVAGLKDEFLDKMPPPRRTKVAVLTSNETPLT